MGVIYIYKKTHERVNFGSIYVKGNSIYIRINPRLDFNAHRTLYEGFKTPMTGVEAIHIGTWHHAKAEVIDSVCHFYVGSMTVPKMTFDAFEWKSFNTDKRGCVVSGHLTKFLGGKYISYFHHVIHADSTKIVNLHTSSNEALAYWLNGEFLGYDDEARYAWYDFWKNSDHKGISGPNDLKPGNNSLLISVRGGKYAGGGFFVQLGREE
jgi:hypothetical protein